MQGEQPEHYRRSNEPIRDFLFPLRAVTKLLKYRISGSRPGQFPFQRNIRTHEPSSRRCEAAIAGPFQLDGATLLWPSRTVQEQPGGATGRNGGRRGVFMSACL